MSRASVLAMGAMYGVGGQLTTFVIQFSYSAVTSRIVDATGFGYYGIALAASALFGMFATAGLGQVSMLLDDTSERQVRYLVGIATATGMVFAAALLLSAQLWATMWGQPQAAGATAFAAIYVLLAPQAVVVSGVARRLGMFKQVALITLISNVLGMAIGLAVTLYSRNASALLVSTIVAQLAIAVALRLQMSKAYVPHWDNAVCKTHLKFMRRVLVFGVLAYPSKNILRLGVSRYIGAPEYGNWNRSDVVTAVPLQTVENAIMQVVYPEFRHYASEPSRARIRWTQMLILTAWTGFPTAAVACVVAPVAIPILFGDGWALAASLAPMLAVAAGLQMPGTMLSSGLQALNLQEQTWRSEASVLVSMSLCLVMLAITHDIAYAMIGVVVAPVVRHLSDLVYCARHRLVAVGDLVRGYALALGASATLGAGAFVICLLLQLPNLPVWARIVGPVSVVAILGASIWIARRRLPPLQLLTEIKAGRA